MSNIIDCPTTGDYRLTRWSNEALFLTTTRRRIQRVDALRAFGLTLTSDAAVPSSYSYKSLMKDRSFPTALAADPLQVQAAPSVALYQYQICPFCNAAKAVLCQCSLRGSLSQSIDQGQVQMVRIMY
jgi:hypothetical protein